MSKRDSHAPIFRSSPVARAKSRATGLGAILVVAAIASAAQGQFSSGTQVGPSPPTEIEGFEAIEAGMDDALWDLRSVRLDPWIGIVDAGFNDHFDLTSSNGETSFTETTFDFRIVAGGGLRAYLPFGSHVIVFANALEEYNAWVDNSDLNAATFSWETGIYAHGNRLDVQLRAASREEQRYATSEIQQLANTRDEAVEAAFEVRMVRSLYLFANAADRESTNEALRDEDVGSPVFTDLDRTEEVYRTGLRVELGRSVDIGVGYETSETDFAGTDRSNEATAPVLEFDYSGPKFALLLDVGRYDVTPQPGSILVPFEETMGTAWLNLNPEGRFGIALYGRRFASYSVSDNFSHFVEEVYGVDVGVPITDRTRLSLFAETGIDDYEPLAGLLTSREDDLLGWGASIRIPLTRHIGFTIEGSQQEFDSNIAEADRDVSRIGIGIDFGLGAEGRLAWPSWP